MEEEQPPTKWEGKASTRLKGPSMDQVWSLLLNDFTDYHKWHPSIDTCRKVDGVVGEPGCVRYCAGTALAPPGEPFGWVHEKLIAVDIPGRSYTYEVTDSNLGLTGYRSTAKVLPDSGDSSPETGEAGAGCVIEWSFTLDPIQGMSREDMVTYAGQSLEGLGRKIEEAFAI